MKFEALVECDPEEERWHRVLSIDFEPETGKIFISISHGLNECGFPLDCSSSVLITRVKGFRERSEQ